MPAQRRRAEPPAGRHAAGMPVLADPGQRAVTIPVAVQPQDDTPIGASVRRMLDENVAAAQAARAAASGPQPVMKFQGKESERAVTEQNQAAPAVQAPADAKPMSVLDHLHNDLAKIGSTVEHAWPIIRRMAVSPRMHAIVDAVLRAEGLGVAAEVFDAVTDSLNAASDRREAQVAAQQAAPGQQSAPPPVPAAPVGPGGTGPQTVQFTPVDQGS